MATKLAVLVLLCCVFVAQANVNVYVDNVLSPFADWGWGTKNATDTTQKHSGTASYSFVPNNYNAAYFYNSASFSSASYSQLTFWVYRTSGSDSNIIFNMIVYNGTSNKVGTSSAVSVYTGGSWAANTWVQATVTLSTFPVQSYNGFWLQYNAAAPTTSYTVYIDDVTLVSATATTAATTATTAKATTTTATTAKASTTTTTTAKAATTTTTAASTTATTAKAATTTTTGASTTATTAKAATTTTTAASTTATTAKAATTTTSSTTGKTSTTTGSTSGTVVAANSTLTALYTTTFSGQGTYYGVYSSGGNCLLDPTPPNGLASAGISVTVAIADYESSAACGMCLRVTGSGVGSGASPITGTQIVFVNNLCPSCTAHGLDFGESGDGVWDITWTAVPCEAQGNIQYIFKSGSSAYWIGLQPRNTVVPVNTLEILIGGVWVNLPRDTDNYFLGGVSQIIPPFQVRLTSIFGEQNIDTFTTILSDQTTVVTGSFQFTKTS